MKLLNVWLLLGLAALPLPLRAEPVANGSPAVAGSAVAALGTRSIIMDRFPEYRPERGFDQLLGVGISAGVFLPFDPDVQNAYPPVWGGLNLTYAVPAGIDAAHRFSLGYRLTTRKIDSGFVFTYYTPGVFRTDTMFHMVPITYTILMGPGALRRGAYFGVGPGFYIGKSEVTARLTIAGETLEDSNGLWAGRFGLNGVLGYAFNRHFALEANYTHMLGQHLIMEYQGGSLARRMDGVAISLSGRF